MTRFYFVSVIYSVILWNYGEKIIGDIVVGVDMLGHLRWIGLESPMDQCGPLPERNEHLAGLS